MVDMTATIGRPPVQVHFGENAFEAMRQAALASGAREDAQESAVEASEMRDAAMAVVRYRRTLAEGVSDFAVGEYFSSAETGELRVYRRIATAPQYEDEGDDVAPITKARIADDDGANLMGSKRSELGAIRRTIEDRMRDSVSIRDFGAIGDGSLHTVNEWLYPLGARAREGFTNLAAIQVQYPHVGALSDPIDWAAIQAGINAGKRLNAPEGTYKTGDKALVAATGAYLVGAGRHNRTTIESNIVGASFITTTTTTLFMHFSHMRLQGNGVSGLFGSGHCFNFIKPSGTGGAWTPQNCELEYLRISGFNGQDNADAAGVTKIAAAAIMLLDAIAVKANHIYVGGDGATNMCGHGMYVRHSQNCRADNFIVDKVRRTGIFSYDNENFIVNESDLVGCGDPATAFADVVDPGYPAGVNASGAFVSYMDVDTKVTNTKMKNFNGTALATVKQGIGIKFTGGWYRALGLADIAHVGIYMETSDLTLDGVVFAPAVSTYTSQKYWNVDVLATVNAPACSLTVVNCVFLDLGSQTIGANIRLAGNNPSRRIKAKVIDCIFGSRSTISGTGTVDADIAMSTFTMVASQIGPNIHRAPTNVTRTVGVTATTIARIKSRIAGSIFEAAGGTIAANYNGLNESYLSGSKAYNPGNIANGGNETTTVTVPGVRIGASGYRVFPSMNVDQKGVYIWGYISADDTVTVVFENRTGSSKDIDSGVLYVAAEEWQAVA